MGKLGFGMMRLPLKSEDPKDFDYNELNAMVDAFLDAGFTYFDTSMVEATFQSQLANLGVDYIDYYLIHDI